MLELEQYAQDITGIRKSILAAGEALHIDHMREQIDELTEEMNQPEFWNDTDRSTRVNQKLGHLKNRLEHYEHLLSSADDIDTMMELAKEENDEDMVKEEARLTQARRELSEEEQAELDRTLMLLRQETARGRTPLVRIRYFVPDERKAGGREETVSVRVKRVDLTRRLLILLADNGISPGRSLRLADVCAMTPEDPEEGLMGLLPFPF